MKRSTSDFLESTRKKLKESRSEEKKGSLLQRVRLRERAIKVGSLETEVDHLQGRAADIRHLLRTIFVHTVVGASQKRRTSIDLDYLVDRISADFLYTKDDTRQKILQFAEEAPDYCVVRVDSYVYIGNYTLLFLSATFF